jgi:Arc-like DNA binding domain
MTEPSPKTAINVRFPAGLYDRLRELAWRRRTSINGLLVQLVVDELERESATRGGA